MGFPVVSVEGKGWIVTVSLALPAEESSVTKAVQSDKYKERSYREIAEEMTVLKLNYVAAAGYKMGQRFPLLNAIVSFT